MLIKEVKKTPVEKSGSFQENTFKIKAGAKAFRALSDTLYSNKPRAIIRELSTNAYDAHVAAKQKKPFFVHIPNVLEPYFSIRDYGTGLSHQDLTEVYTTYFESTKTSSNDYVGCLGLGSKSPFCYTDSFTVTSYFNGAKSVYTAYIADDGVPTIALLSSASTDEENGLEIYFPVDSYDFGKFQQEAIDVYKYFDLKPEIGGLSSEIPEKPSGKINGTFDGIKWWFTGQNPVILMGQVAYPLDISLDYKYNHLVNNNGLHIEAPIGMFDVALSREKLSFDPETLKQVQLVLDKILEEVKGKLQKEIDDCTTLMEAIHVYTDNHSLYDNFIRNVKWRGIKVETSYDFEFTEPIKIFTYGYKKAQFLKKIYFHPLYTNNLVLTDDSAGANIRCQSLPGNVYLGTKEQIGKIQDFFDIPDSEITLLKDIPYTPQKRNGNVRKEKVFQFSRGSTGTDSWSDVTVNWNDPHIYVGINRYNILLNGNEIKHTDFRYTLNVIRDVLGIKFHSAIIGVKKALLKKVEKNKEWYNFYDVLKPILKEWVTENSIKLSSSTYYNDNYEIWKDNQFSNCEDTDVQKMHQLTQNIEIGYLERNNYQEIVRLCRKLDVDVEIKDYWSDLHKKLMETYPLMKFANRYNAEDKDFVEYINLKFQS